MAIKNLQKPRPKDGSQHANLTKTKER